MKDTIVMLCEPCSALSRNRRLEGASCAHRARNSAGQPPEPGSIVWMFRSRADQRKNGLWCRERTMFVHVLTTFDTFSRAWRCAIDAFGTPHRRISSDTLACSMLARVLSAPHNLHR
ncbi:MAG: hypothetical protein Q9O74_10960 [Planctomycetota bacterium]|nr:hypothetical protein [Planctomycetota bacterium]